MDFNVNEQNQETNLNETVAISIVQNATSDIPNISTEELYHLDVATSIISNEEVINNQLPHNSLGSMILSEQPRFRDQEVAIAQTLTTQPQSLYLQALAKIGQRSNSLEVLNLNSMNTILRNDPKTEVNKSPNLSAPNSLTSAPPSYSFVLRQMNVRRRPRFMGTFIPSPSFIQHTPPPNYAQAFDIYVDNSLPQPTPINRTYNFGFQPMLVICPECGFAGNTTIKAKVTFCTHFCAISLCLCSCWFCVPLPYMLTSCKNVYHYCANCRNLLGVYCPTNPQTI